MSNLNKDQFGVPAQYTEHGDLGVAASLPQGALILRGERRTVTPSPEFPDPASADPEALLRHFLTTHWGIGESKFRRMEGSPPAGSPDNSVGVHWTPSEMIAQRFSEHFGGENAVQNGRPMKDWESRGIREHELYEISHRLGTYRRPNSTASRVRRAMLDTHDPVPEDWDPENGPYQQSYRPYVFRDLSGDYQHRGRYPTRDAAAPFNMGVIWHGSLDHSAVDTDSRVTRFEKEIDLRHGSSVKIHGATMHIPEAGKKYSYSQGGNWNSVQFKEPLIVRIKEGRGAK